MYRYLENHRHKISNILETKTDYDWKKLAKYNRTRISFFQHERLIHLLVTLFVGLYAIISIYVTVWLRQVEFILVDILLIVLFIPYVFHYYQLENAVQSLYRLDEEINKRINDADLV